jgi:hypothetical protein
MNKLSSATFALLAFSMLSTDIAGIGPNEARAGQAINYVNLPASGESGRNTPPCNDGGPTTADEIVSKLGRSIDKTTQYGPIAETIVANPSVRNWLKVRLGIHNGPSTCATLCVNIPANVTYNWEVCASDGRTSCKSSLKSSSFGEFGIGWSLVENLTNAIADGGNDRVVCVRVRNWKHDRSRDMKLTVTW